VYQFTSLKYRCLDKCRSPVSFVLGHWRGRHERRQALWLGMHHGVFCLGCCWSLMLLMFAVGLGNLAWMFALAVVMAVEKNAPWGRRLTAPLGAVLLLVAAVLVAAGASGHELLAGG
jgi:predicted metal-binding membrane protein